MQNLPEKWQLELANAITHIDELCQILELDKSAGPKILGSDNLTFTLRAPRGYVSRIEKGNWQDPLLLQILPLAKETEINSDYCEDPLHEEKNNPVPGLLHKYRGRVLLITASACPIHCRYCFRRYFPYEDNTPGLAGWQSALEYIEKDCSISEVILSGGDPLILKDASLQYLIEKLSTIPHLQTLRLHTRIPIVLPERITPALINILNSSRLKKIIVVHCNHPREIDQQVRNGLIILSKAGITLLNQFVLLRNINDNAGVLIELAQQLFAVGVLPYYLHLLDPIQGSAHFAVSEKTGLQLIHEISSHLPGYLVPKLVREKPGYPAKVSVTSKAAEDFSPTVSGDDLHKR